MAMLAAPVAQAATEAKAPGPCLTPREIHGFVAFILPGITAGVVAKCRTTVSPTGYFNTRGAQLGERLAAGKDAAWPVARDAFNKISHDSAKDTAHLSDTTTRSLVEHEMVEQLTGQIPTAMCRDIESVIEPLDPLPTDNLVQFVSAIFGVAGRGDSKMRACPSS